MSRPIMPPLVTLFGADGFIGRYVAEQLLKSGARLRVAARDPRRAWFLQPLGSVGQISLTKASWSNRDSIARACQGSDAVINCTGAFKGDLETLHRDGPAHAAAIAKAQGASFVHLSAIGADVTNESRYGRTKGEGEDAIRKADPKATIIRSSTVFGPEDQFTNRFAGLAALPFLPLPGAATRFQPVYVRDLARAIAAAALDPAAHGGKTYEIGGPEVMSLQQIVEKVAHLSGREANVIALPDFAGDLMSRFGFLPGAPLTRDQWIMLQKDNIPAKNGLAAFGIAPTALEAVAGEWLGRYRTGGRFAARAEGAAS